MINSYFTIFTPTYNRADLLPRAYESICAQNFPDLEWIIVDDGSTDNTQEIVGEWMNQADFPIKYFRQENSGRHIAINKGIELASGQLFVILDSDDWFTENSLERTKTAWGKIPVVERADCAGLWGLCASSDGQIIGEQFPDNDLLSDTIHLRYTHGVAGDKCHATRLDVRREFLFPDYGERYCPPSLVWNRIARKYKTCLVNEVLQYKEYQPGGLSAKGDTKIVASPKGFVTRNLELLKYNSSILSSKNKKKIMSALIRACFHANMSVVAQLMMIKPKLLWVRSLPKAYQKYKDDMNENPHS